MPSLGGWQEGKGFIVPTYDDTIARTDVQSLIPEDVSKEIIQGMAQSSVVMRVARKMPNMPSNQRRIPVLNALAQAYFVSGDIGLRQTTQMAWKNKYFNVEEIACIVPISKNVLDDVAYDIWGEAKPRIIAEFGRVFDRAVLVGENAPASWPTSILDAATGAGKTVSLAAFTDIYDAILGEDGLFQTNETDGWEMNRCFGPLSLKSKLRGNRSSEGVPIFRPAAGGSLGGAFQAPSQYELDGIPLDFPANGSQDRTEAWLYAGDFNQVVWCTRMDMTWEILREAVIQAGDGSIVYNLAQQSMVALKAEMRVAWQVPNPIQQENQVEANRYPVSVLLP
jgi:HK97 family phage major capsid protein